MVNRYIIFSILGAVALAVALLVFSTEEIHTDPSNELVVATTIFPLADIIQNVGGDDVRVVQLLQPGASAHSAALTPQDLAQARGAQVIFIIGHGFDDWVGEAVSAAVDVPVIVVDDGIEIRAFEESAGDPHDDHGHGEGGDDPHYWLTAPNAKLIAENVMLALQELDPDSRDVYADNFLLYSKILDELEEELQNRAQEVTKTRIIALHDAWSYFADHYGFDLVATYEPVEGRNPSLQELEELREVVNLYGVRNFFTEPQKESSGAIRFLRDDLGLQIKVLDPIGGTEERPTYVNMMLENMRAIYFD